MARKSWDSLTPTYRHRLERGGVTRSQYESGASLKAARGHRATPEHGAKVIHISKRPRVREQWTIGKPGPRGGGRPRPGDVRKAMDQHITTPDVILTITFLAPVKEEEDKKRYKKSKDELEDLEVEPEDEEEEEKPTPKKKKAAFPPEGQQIYVYSATVNRGQFRLAMDTLAGLPRNDHKAGMIQYAEQITGGQFSPITDVLSISVSNTKS